MYNVSLKLIYEITYKMFSFERTGKGRFGFGFRIRISDSFLKDSVWFDLDSIPFGFDSV